MAKKPDYHWTFNEGTGTGSNDVVGGTSAKFHKAGFSKYGRIGRAIQLNGKDSRVVLGKKPGQFGTSDFTLSFGMLVMNTHGQSHLDIISNRNVTGHGNWFSLRQIKTHQLQFEIDENNKKKHYAQINTAKVLTPNQWVHIAIVRRGKELRIYVDGTLAANGNSRDDGIADIKGNAEVKLGHWKEHTAKAKYEDLRIYNQALSEEDIKALVPEQAPLLKTDQVELIAADGSRKVFSADKSNLVNFCDKFQKLRLGPNTGATLYNEKDFSGVSQKFFAGIGEVQRSKLKDFPQSIHLWSTLDQPFQGKWIVRAPNGEYLQWQRSSLSTTTHCLENSLFSFNFNQRYGQLQLVPATKDESLLMSIDGETSPLTIDDTESGDAAFSIVHKSNLLWLAQSESGKFNWTADKTARAVFLRAAKHAENESQVGDLKVGEVALYQHVNYHGKAWVFSDEADGVGNFTNFDLFFGLNNTTSSIRLGPETGITLFANKNQAISDADRETDIEDIVNNEPVMADTQIGDDNLSSLKIFKRVSPSKLFTSITSKLSQDYRMVGDELEEFSSYRTILRLEPEVSEVEVSATDLTTIEVDDTHYEIDELRTVTLKPNRLNQIMVTTPAEGIDTPALKFRTQDMGENERVVIAPDQELHQKIASLEDNALWNAKDANGDAVVDQKKHKQAEVASIQNTIKRVMASVTPENTSSELDELFLHEDSVIQSQASTKLTMNAEDQSAWAINFDSPSSTNDTLLSSVQSVNLSSDSAVKNSVLSSAKDISSKTNSPKNAIWEEKVEAEDFNRLLSIAPVTNSNINSTSVLSASLVQSSSLISFSGVSHLRSFRNFFNDIGDALKHATKATLGFANNVLNAVIEIGAQTVRFVLDTAKKVADFVTSILEKVVTSIKQFIEFLRFLFDWKDILVTQRAIKKNINATFDSAAEFVNSAKQPVMNAINDVKEIMTDGIDDAIRALGAEPSSGEQKKGRLSEAAEWFLNRMLGGFGKNDNKEAVEKQASEVTAASAAQNSLSHILGMLESAAGVGLDIGDGVIDIFEAFITNPTRPELALVALLETAKEVASGVMDIAEHLMLAILDAIVAAIKALKHLLNAEMKIPLLSKLFELIGAGNLSLINLLTVLVAIPATVSAKLITGKAPFQQENSVAAIAETPTPKGITQSSIDAMTALKSATVAKTDGNDSAVDEVQLEEQLIVDASMIRKVEDFGSISLASDLIAGVLTAALDSVGEDKDDEGKVTFPLEILCLGLGWLSWLGSFPASVREPGGYPYLLHKNKVSKTANPKEYFERVMWGVRTTILSLETIFVMMSAVEKIASGSSGQPSNTQMQMLKRANENTNTASMVLSLVNAAVTIVYLSKTPVAERDSLEIVNESVGLLPDIGAVLFIHQPTVLAGLDFISAFIGHFYGRVILQNNLDELEALMELENDKDKR